MLVLTRQIFASLLLLAPTAALCQAPATPPPPAAVDADLEHAQALIGRALILRGFYDGHELAYDAEGKVTGSPKTTDWTLSGMDVGRVERKGPGQIRLEGLRVAIKYNPDQHIFERHPLKEERLVVQVEDAGQPKALDAALANIFSTGIDPALQRSMPDYWAHYFIASQPWPQDALAGKQVFLAGATPTPGWTPAVAEKKVEPHPTVYAERDLVKGNMQLRMVVDEQGQARHIAILTPIGYGLDERTVEAMRQWRFKPATHDQQPAPAVVVVNQGFAFQAAPHP